MEQGNKPLLSDEEVELSKPLISDEEVELPTLKKKASSEDGVGVPTLLKAPSEGTTSQSEQGGLDFSQTPSEIVETKIHSNPKILTSNKDRPNKDLLYLRNQQLIKLGEQSSQKIKGIEEAYKQNPTQELTDEYNKELNKLKYYDQRYKETAKELETAPLSAEASMRNSMENIITGLKGAIPRLSLLSADVWERTLGKEMAKGMYANDPLGGRDIEQVRFDAYKKLDELAKEMKPTANATESLRDLNIATSTPNLDISERVAIANPKMAAASLVDAISAVATTAIPTLATGGAGLFSEMAGQSLYDFNESKAKSKGKTIEQLYQDNEAEIGVPLTIGAIAMGLEKVGLKGIEKAINTKIANKGLRGLTELAYETNKEGLTEYLQAGLDVANISIAEGKSNEQVAKDVVKELGSKDAMEAYLKGALGSVGSVGAGKVGKSLFNIAKSPLVKEKVQVASDKIDTLTDELDNPELSAEAESVIKQTIESEKSIIEQDIKSDLNTYYNLSEEDKRQVDWINSDLRDLDDKITMQTKILEDESVSPQTKEVAQKQISEIEAQKEILNADLEKFIGEKIVENKNENGNPDTNIQPQMESQGEEVKPSGVDVVAEEKQGGVDNGGVPEVVQGNGQGVGSINKKVFVHETNADSFDEFDLDKAGSGQGDNWLGKGVYLQEKGTFKVESYGKNKVETKLKPNAKIFETKETPNGKYRDNFVEWAVENTEVGKRKAQERIDEGLSLDNLLPRDILKRNPEVVEKLKEQGYDGLYIDGELVVYNPKVLEIKKAETSNLPLEKSVGENVEVVTPKEIAKEESPVFEEKNKTNEELQTPKIETNDKENKSGVQSNLGERKEPKQTKSNKVGSGEEIEASRVLQEQEEVKTPKIENNEKDRQAVGNNPTTESKSNLKDSKASKSPKGKRVPKGVSPRVKAALSLESGDLQHKVMQYFVAGGKINSSVFQELFGKAGDEKLNKAARSEANQRFGLWNNKTGLSINKIAHKLWEENGGSDSGWTDHDFRNAVEAVVKDYNGTSRMIDALNKATMFSEETSEMTEEERIKHEEEKYYRSQLTDEQEATLDLDQAEEVWQTLTDEQKLALVNDQIEAEELFNQIDRAEAEKKMSETKKAIDVYKRLSENNDTSTRKEYKALPESIKKVLDNIVNIHKQLEEKNIITKKGNCP